MARKKQNEILVGLVSLTGITLLLVLIFLMGSFDALTERRTTVEARFRDVQGLSVGDPVYLFGMKAGTVDAIELLEKERQNERAELAVMMNIPASYRDYLRENTPVHIDKSLTGSISVLIHETEDGSGAELPEGAWLAGRGGAELGEIATEARGLLEKGREAVDSVSRIVKGIEERGELRKALDNVAKLTEELKSKVQPITASMEDTLESVNRVVAENEKDFRETMSNLRESTALARGFVGKLDKVPQQLEEGLKVLTGAGKSVDALIADNRTNLDLMIDDLRETASGAATLVSEVKRRPWRLLYKPSVDEMKALELYDAAWAYNIGAAELYRSVRVLSDRLRQSSDGDDEEAEQLVKLAMEQVRASLRSQRRAEEAFWKRLGEGE